MNPRRVTEELLADLLFVLAVVLPAGLLLGLVAAFLLPSGPAFDGTAAGLVHGLIAETRRLGLAGTVPWAVLWLGLGLGIRDLIRGRGRRGVRIVGRATTLALLVCVGLASREPDLAALSIGLCLGGLGVLFALLAGGWAARRAAGILLLALLASSCGYVFGDYDGGPVAEPGFAVLRIRSGDTPFEEREDLRVWLYVDEDGTIGREPETPLPEPLPNRLFKYAEIKRDMFHALQPSLVILALVPNAEAGWDKLRPAFAAAGHKDVRIHRVRLTGFRGDSTEVAELAAELPYRGPDGERWEFRGAPPNTRITLTPAARNGIDAAALGARVKEGPVLLAAADGVPAQVVADAIAALHDAGAEPVVLSPDAPEPGGEETLPGVRIE